ncbi:MAG: T9SS type A sorting domain-containing protein [Bacteroidales bacterium]|jgi:hypothetical protein|nr:T9SS type A sorting domain-containing protein [Bacteroidales bacterium]
MKKIPVLLILLSAVFCVNAQQYNGLRDVVVSSKQPANERIDASLIKKENNQHVAKHKKPAHKGNVNYSQPVLVSNLSFAYLEINNNVKIGGSIRLFPDSLAFSFLEYTNLSSLNSEQVNFAATGFIFDPYSKSFDSNRVDGLFSTENTYYGYKIDTITTVIDYRIANYNPASPDTLRFYIFSHDLYYPGVNPDEYYTLAFLFQNNYRHGLSPVVEYSNPIHPKGGYATKPKAQNCLVVDYILSPADSIVVPPGFISGKIISCGIPNEGFEVEPGSVTGVLMKYIPGYDYNVDDTISKLTLTYPNTLVSETINMNRLDVRTWDYNLYPKAEVMWDAYGYNSFLMEDMGIRYATDTVDYGNGAMYNAAYYSKPAFNFSAAVGDNFITLLEIDTAACGSFTYNNTVYTESGRYEHLFTSALGGDSLVVLHLEIYDSPDPVGNITGNTLIEEAGVHIYTVDQVPNAAYYFWQLEGSNSGWAIEGSEQDRQVAVHVRDTGSATLYMYAVHSNRVCYSKDSIRLETSPTMLGEIDDIQGDMFVDQFGNYTYRVFPVTNAGSYLWEIAGDNQWEIIGEGNQISLNISDTGSGILSVKAFDSDSVDHTQTVSLSIRYCNALGAMENIRGESLIAEFGTYTYSINPVDNAVAYEWEVENPWLIIGDNSGTSVDVSIEENATGKLFVKVFDNCGRERKDSLLILTDVNSMASLPLKNTIKVYPNPATDNVNILFEQELFGSVDILLYDVAGKMLNSQHVTDQSVLFNVNTVSAGLYFLQIRKDNQIIKVEKIIKR